MTNLQEQIRQVESKIEDLKIKLMVEESVLKRLKAIDNPEQPQQSLNVVNTPATYNGSLVEHIKAVLFETNRSVTVKEICDMLTARGVTTNAKAGLGSAIACAMARRDDLFHRVRRGLYGLRNQEKSNL